jgi:pimeloyl-ACP methyl ester carboxylesterase
MPHSTTRDGVRIYFEAHGQGEPVLLAYGIGGNTGMWEPNIDALSAHHRLILWEPRGHARSDSPEDPRQVTFAHWTWDLHDLLDHLKIERGIVGGLSLGGGIATRFALAHPGRVRALLIIDSSSASGLPLGVDNIVMRAKSIEVTLAGGMDAMADFAIASNPNVSGRIKLDPSARKEIFDYYRMLTPIGYANALRALLQMDYITDRLGEITAPTLLVCGDEDPSLGPMREIQKRIPHASFTLLSPAGHFANRDQPEAFNRAVSDFLKSLA